MIDLFKIKYPERMAVIAYGMPEKGEPGYDDYIDTLKWLFPESNGENFGEALKADAEFLYGIAATLPNPDRLNHIANKLSHLAELACCLREREL